DSAYPPHGLPWTAEAPLSPSVTSRVPHGRKVLACHPGEGMTPLGVHRDRQVSLATGCGNQEHQRGHKRHRFYPRAFPVEPGEPIGHVKVLTNGSTPNVGGQNLAPRARPVAKAHPLHPTQIGRASCRETV